jgi:hypothetical protein
MQLSDGSKFPSGRSFKLLDSTFVSQPALQHFQGDGETGLTCKAKLKKYRTIYQPLARVFHIVSIEQYSGQN